MMEIHVTMYDEVEANLVPFAYAVVALAVVNWFFLWFDLGLHLRLV